MITSWPSRVLLCATLHFLSNDESGELDLNQHLLTCASALNPSASATVHPVRTVTADMLGHTRLSYPPVL